MPDPSNFSPPAAKAAAVPDLPHTDARAVVRGACTALASSPAAALPAVGAELRELARAIETMHLDDEAADA